MNYGQDINVLSFNVSFKILQFFTNSFCSSKNLHLDYYLGRTLKLLHLKKKFFFFLQLKFYYLQKTLIANLNYFV